MRLGIDLGTTRVVVASADRGNYPVVTFDNARGEGQEWFPSLMAIKGDRIACGPAAEAVATDPAWQVFRGLKRHLAVAGPMDLIFGMPAPELVTHFLTALRLALVERSNLRVGRGEPLEVAVAVPANATGNQRMLTADAFVRAGFQVHRILDEPSAAGLEYAWRRPADAQIKKRHVAVYDLGGGTFDASVIAMSDALHEVLTTEGIARLGGEDFDEALLALCCRQADRPLPEGPERHRLLEICRAEKERLTPSSRRLSPELFEGTPVRVDVEAYDAAVRPLIEHTLEAVDLALGRTAERVGHEVERHTVVYQVGGASQLPAVGRALRERFGRRVWRSPYPHASVAIGLAIAAEEVMSPRITGSLTRHFGVWRERDGGHNLSFDPIFAKDTALGGPLVEVRRYRAHHNIGHFRYVECSRLTAGAPAGDVTPWSEARIPFSAELCGRPLEQMPVERLPGDGAEVEERYRCDENGVIQVEIKNLTAGYATRVAAGGSGAADRGLI